MLAMIQFSGATRHESAVHKLQRMRATNKSKCGVCAAATERQGWRAAMTNCSEVGLARFQVMKKKIQEKREVERDG